MNLLQKSNFKNFRFNFDEEKKFSNGIFSKILLYNPPNFYFIMVLIEDDLRYLTAIQYHVVPVQRPQVFLQFLETFFFPHFPFFSSFLHLRTGHMSLQESSETL